jgi:hypothetical protein
VSEEKYFLSSLWKCGSKLMTIFTESWSFEAKKQVSVEKNWEHCLTDV